MSDTLRVTGRWEQLAREASGDDYAEVYRQRIADLAAAGDDVHGEADFVERLVSAPARVLDAGCGTGRVAARLHDRGYDVVGCDADATMIAAARRDRPTLDWRVGDLADAAHLAGAGLSGPFEVIVLAGNVVPLLDAASLPRMASAMAGVLAPDGVLVAGFGLDARHLPAGCPSVPLAEVDAAMRAAGLGEVQHRADWDGNPFTSGGYVVGAYRRSTG